METTKQLAEDQAKLDILKIKNEELLKQVNEKLEKLRVLRVSTIEFINSTK